MNKRYPGLTFFLKIMEPLKKMRHVFKKDQPAPELWELEAQFYKDANLGPERVRNRQFAASIRSGRG